MTECTLFLKVTVNNCIKTIELEDQYSLDNLYYVIQKSVDFGMHHFYYFQFRSGVLKTQYFSPECDEQHYSAIIFSLSELHLYEGLNFQYIFDFGDNWISNITVEQILLEHTEKYEIIHI